MIDIREHSRRASQEKHSDQLTFIKVFDSKAEHELGPGYLCQGRKIGISFDPFCTRPGGGAGRERG